MTITIWIRRKIVLNWPTEKKDLNHLFDVCTREPGDLDYLQVNVSLDEYLTIINKSHEEDR
tara:strand:+ start:450 stop:632 length:183 start_codon:yes stop_codon:yes gene_type:complete